MAPGPGLRDKRDMRTTSDRAGAGSLPWAVLAWGISCALALAAFVVVLAISHPTTAAAPSYSLVTVGGLEYQAMDGRPLDPANSADAAILAGVPARERRTAPGEELFGAFVAVTNPTQRVLAPARTIALAADPGELYPAITLPASSPYAFPTRPIHPDTRIPAGNSPAADNLAAGARLVLFRIPARVYENAQLALVIHDPLRPAATASLDI
jgi:hypothetical protein